MNRLLLTLPLCLAFAVPTQAHAEPNPWVPMDPGFEYATIAGSGTVHPEGFVVLPIRWGFGCDHTTAMMTSRISVTPPNSDITGNVGQRDHLPGLFVWVPDSPLPDMTTLTFDVATHSEDMCLVLADLSFNFKVDVSSAADPANFGQRIDTIWDQPTCGAVGERVLATTFDVLSPMYTYEAPSPNNTDITVRQIGTFRYEASRLFSGAVGRECMPVVRRHVVTDETVALSFCGIPTDGVVVCDDGCHGGTPPSWPMAWTLLVGLGLALRHRKPLPRDSLHTSRGDNSTTTNTSLTNTKDQA